MNYRVLLTEIANPAKIDTGNSTDELLNATRTTRARRDQNRTTVARARRPMNRPEAAPERQPPGNELQDGRCASDLRRLLWRRLRPRQARMRKTSTARLKDPRPDSGDRPTSGPGCDCAETWRRRTVQSGSR